MTPTPSVEGQEVMSSQSCPSSPDGGRPETPSLLERAIFIAAAAHNGQVDKAGAPYILHLMRVSQALDGEDRIVGVLHDILEDCHSWSPQLLRKEGFSEDVVQAVMTLTRDTDEGYDAFIQRAAQNPIARRVKLADLADNSDLSRLPNPGSGDHIRVEKYARAIKFLQSSEAQSQRDNRAPIIALSSTDEPSLPNPPEGERRDGE